MGIITQSIFSFPAFSTFEIVLLYDVRVYRKFKGFLSLFQVCIVEKKDTKQMFAMKYMNKHQCMERDALKNVLREVEILTKLDHPFLVNIWFSFQGNNIFFYTINLKILEKTLVRNCPLGILSQQIQQIWQKSQRYNYLFISQCTKQVYLDKIIFPKLKSIILIMYFN